MANIDNPRGFTPVAMLDGSAIPVRRFPVYASQADGIFIGDVIKALSSGNVEAADAGDDKAVLGVCVGIFDTNGTPIGEPNSSVSTKYLTATTGGYVNVALALPSAVFRVQCLSAATPASTDVFAASDHTATAGSTAMAQSRHELTASFSTDAQFKVIGKVDEPGNDWAEHVDVLVVAQESYWYGEAAGL